MTVIRGACSLSEKHRLCRFFHRRKRLKSCARVMNDIAFLFALLFLCHHTGKQYGYGDFFVVFCFFVILKCCDGMRHKDHAGIDMLRNSEYFKTN